MNTINSMYIFTKRRQGVRRARVPAVSSTGGGPRESAHAQDHRGWTPPRKDDHQAQGEPGRHPPVLQP